MWRKSETEGEVTEEEVLERSNLSAFKEKRGVKIKKHGKGGIPQSPLMSQHFDVHPVRPHCACNLKNSEGINLYCSDH